jgi:hypothetical protein
MTMTRTLASLAVLALAVTAAAAQRSSSNGTLDLQPLPRGAGPVRLGMGSSNFSRIAHVSPDCTKAEQCGPHETRASAFIDTMPPQSGGLPGVQQFTAYFIRDSLFSLTMRPPDARLATVRAYYTGLFGAPSRQDTTDDGSGRIIWETKTTRFIVHYVRNATPRGPPPGSVTFVEIVDVRLAREAEIDRGNRPWP